MKNPQYLCDPYTKEPLQLSKLGLSNATGQEYQEKDGVFVLIDESKIEGHLASQVQYFEDEMMEMFDPSSYHISAWQQTYLDRFIENFGEVEGKVIIDCGAGSGYMSITLAERGAYVIACDLTLMNLIKLRQVAIYRGIEDKMQFVCCSAEELPFQDMIADYFISNAVLEHLPNEPQAIKEIHRVIKDGAGVMITVPLSYTYLNPILLPINYVYDQRIGHLRRYNESILIRKMSPLQKIKTYYTGHTRKVLGVLFNMMFKREIISESWLEKTDDLQSKNKWFASNIIMFFRS